MIAIEHPYKGRPKFDAAEKRLSAEMKRYARERRPGMVQWIFGQIVEHVQEKDAKREAKEAEAAVQNEVAAEIKERESRMPRPK